MIDEAGHDPDAGSDRWATPLRVLAPFADRIGEPDFEFGAWGGGDRLPNGTLSMPYHELAAGGEALIAACGAWLQVGFDWSNWARTEEGKGLMEDPTALARATPEQIARVLTLLIRANRFNEGQLEWAWRSGLFQRILDRVAALQVVAHGAAGPVDNDQTSDTIGDRGHEE